MTTANDHWDSLWANHPTECALVAAALGVLLLFTAHSIFTNRRGWYAFGKGIYALILAVLTAVRLLVQSFFTNIALAPVREAVGNLGDCRAVVSRAGRALALSADHKPTLEVEKNSPSTRKKLPQASRNIETRFPRSVSPGCSVSATRRTRSHCGTWSRLSAANR